MEDIGSIKGWMDVLCLDGFLCATGGLMHQWTD